MADEHSNHSMLSQVEIGASDGFLLMSAWSMSLDMLLKKTQQFALGI